MPQQSSAQPRDQACWRQLLGLLARVDRHQPTQGVSEGSVQSGREAVHIGALAEPRPLVGDAWARGAKAGSCFSWNSPISLELPLPAPSFWVPDIPVCKKRGNLPVQQVAWVERTSGSHNDLNSVG